MAFDRPSLATLIGRVRSDFRGRLGLSGSLVRRAMADVMAAVWAGGIHMLHGHLDWVAKQLFPDTAERESLLRQAAMYGLTPTPATYASGTVLATGTNGSAIAEDLILQREDGVTYRVTAAAVIASGEAVVSVEAVDAGSDPNLDEGEELTFESPVTGVDAEVTVEEPGLAGGAEEETTEETRARFIALLRDPPQGGAEHDYEAWALAVPGVTRAWVYPNEDGLGTVVVRFVFDDREDIFPTVGDVPIVQAALDAERPITAEVTAEAPTLLAVAFTIEVTPDNGTVRAAVEAELADLMLREGEPGDGAGRGTILLSAIRTAIGVAAGVEDYVLTVPSADVVPTTGQLARVGTITWA